MTAPLTADQRNGAACRHRWDERALRAAGRGGTVGAVAHMAVSNYGSFREALGVYLGGLPGGGSIRSAILAAAGVIQNDRSALTNSSWRSMPLSCALRTDF